MKIGLRNSIRINRTVIKTVLEKDGASTALKVMCNRKTVPLRAKDSVIMQLFQILMAGMTA